MRPALYVTSSTLLLALCACASSTREATAASIHRDAHYHVELEYVTDTSGETPEWWYRSGAAHAARNGAPGARAKNVIVFLGDGMSLTTVAAARILDGQRKGRTGEENLLSWEHFPYTALSKTYNTDSQTPDSAGTMTAIASGVKTHLGAIGVAAGDRNDCAGSQQRQLLSWLRLADDAGLATGIVTTARLTHATPAATFAHAPDRNWEVDALMPEAARAAGCRDIAQQFLDFAPGRGPTVALGGGRGYFLPTSVQDPEYPARRGLRQDGRNLVEEWRGRHPGARYVWNSGQLATVPDTGPVLGLFEFDHMQYEHERRTDADGEPSLAELTRFAIKRLAGQQDGYVLLVEGGRIDHANHAGNAYRALDETVAMSEAVQVAASMTDPDDTLIVVTSDHSHTLNFVGYPKRGNPILGKVRATEGHKPADYARDLLGLPYTTLVYANGPGYAGASATQPAGPKAHPHAAQGIVPLSGRPDLTMVDTEHPDYMQEALVPMTSESHGGDDVGIWARGPGASAFRGTLEQHVIYHVIVQATPRLREQLCLRGTCDTAGIPVHRPDPARFDGR